MFTCKKYRYPLLFTKVLFCTGNCIVEESRFDVELVVVSCCCREWCVLVFLRWVT